MKCQRIVNAETDQICGFPVSGGGNVHKLGHCPPQAGPWGNRQKRVGKPKRNKMKKDIIVERGAPVVGTGKKGKGEKKKKA